MPKRILIADDDKTLTKMLSSFLVEQVIPSLWPMTGRGVKEA